MSNHIVHTVRLVMPANDYHEARKHQADAKHWVQHTLSDLLGNYLDQLNKDDALIYIDKIAINIPDLPWNLPATTWQQTFASAIRLNKASANTLDIIVKQWFFYLQQGCFEKTAILNSRHLIEKYLLSHTSILTVATLQRYTALLSLPLLQRLFYQHSKELVGLVIEGLLRLQASEVDVVYTAALLHLKRTPHQTYYILARIHEAGRRAATKEKAGWIAVLSGKAPHPSAADLAERSSPITNDTQADQQQPVADIFINCPNAGLVLLLPYMQRFFENCQLLEGEAFVSEATRQTAILALHYLATGETSAAEEELVLPRLLCGMPLQEYTVFEQELPLLMQTEANGLLQDVVGHWQALKNTSSDGFRATFLKRVGRLKQKGETYTLQVEESGVDILLNSIPWGFRNYRLPWMSFHLITEWY